MAYKLLNEETKEEKIKQFRLPNLGGKFGFSIFTGKKEIFIGLSVGEVEIEQIVRKRMIKTPKKGTVKVFRFD